MTPKRDLQFYKNELDVRDHLRVVWEPYSAAILQTLPPVSRESS